MVESSSRNAVRFFFWGLSLCFLLAFHVTMFTFTNLPPSMFIRLAVLFSVLALVFLVGFHFVTAANLFKVWDCVLLFLSITSIINVFVTWFWVSTRDYNHVFLLLFSLQMVIAVLLISRLSTISFFILFALCSFFYVLLFSLLSNVPMHSTVSDFDSFVDHITAHPLGSFSTVVNYPNVPYIKTDLDDVLSSIKDDGLYILIGPAGLRKSVALFNHLKKDHVIWLDARIHLCENLFKLGYTVETKFEQDCLILIQEALNTNNFTLVINDDDAAFLDNLIFQFIVDFGEVEPKFKIFFVVSDYKLYLQRMYNFLRETVFEIRVSYPSYNHIQKICDTYNLKCEEMLRITGPSLELIDQYLHQKSLLRTTCDRFQSLFRTNLHLTDALLEFTRMSTNDYLLLNLEKSNISKEQYDLLITKNVLSDIFYEASFHNPLVRRVVCTYFESHNLPSCNVTLCHQF
ncbi:hypothetical protein GEMRC1_008762 [Eukaryota sp. GEM-RC1]